MRRADSENKKRRQFLILIINNLHIYFKKSPFHWVIFFAFWNLIINHLFYVYKNHLYRFIFSWYFI